MRPKPKGVEKYFNRCVFFFLPFADATNASEAVNLQNRLRSLSSGLVGLRNCMPELAAMNHPAPLGEGLGEAGAATGGVRSAVAAFENGRLPTYQNQPAPSSHPSANGKELYFIS